MAAPNPNKGKSNQYQNSAPKPAQKTAPPAAPVKAAGGGNSGGSITIPSKWVECIFCIFFGIDLHCKRTQFRTQNSSNSAFGKRN
jgi:hypothetical protein